MKIHTNVMRTVSLSVALASLLFLLACGGSGGGFTTPSGNFSASSLNGQFAYQLSGADAAGSFREVGVFTSNGSGTITAGEDDFSQNTSLISTTAIGTYKVFSDGTGTITLNLSDGRSLLFAITLGSTSKVYIVIAQEQVGNNLPLITGAGVGLKQDTAAFAAPPSGTFVFREHVLNIPQGTSSASVGAITVTGGTVAGNEDVNRAGSAGSLSMTGFFNFPDAAGKGTGSFTDSGGTFTFFYYVVDANRFFLLSTDNGMVGIGQAEKQSGGPFSTASLSGGYAFGSQGDTALNFAGVNTVGRFSADGAGGITNGALDSVQDGTSSTNVSFTGSYTVTSNAGRVAVTLNPTGSGAVSQVFWMVSPSRAFFLTNSASKVEDGTLDLQQVSTFSNSTMNGQYAFVMDGFDTSFNTFDRVGTLSWDGSGNSTLDEFINFNGVNNTSGLLGGNYSVSGSAATNGRAVMAVSTLSNNLVFYLISANDAYILQNDTGIMISGTMTKQIQP